MIPGRGRIKKMKDTKNMTTALVGVGMALLALAGGAILGVAFVAKKAIVASLISLAISVVMGIKKFMSTQKHPIMSHEGPANWEVPASLHGSGMDGSDPFGSFHEHHYSHYKSSR